MIDKDVLLFYSICSRLNEIFLKEKFQVSKNPSSIWDEPDDDDDEISEEIEKLKRTYTGWWQRKNQWKGDSILAYYDESNVRIIFFVYVDTVTFPAKDIMDIQMYNTIARLEVGGKVEGYGMPMLFLSAVLLILVKELLTTQKKLYPGLIITILLKDVLKK
jgi:hypothetical protein